MFLGRFHKTNTYLCGIVIYKVAKQEVKDTTCPREANNKLLKTQPL